MLTFLAAATIAAPILPLKSSLVVIGTETTLHMIFEMMLFRF